jgi:hypothetical protein
VSLKFVYGVIYSRYLAYDNMRTIISLENFKRKHFFNLYGAFVNCTVHTYRTLLKIVNMVKTDITSKYLQIISLSFNTSTVLTTTGNIFTVWTGSTALHFTAAGAPLAARRIRILPMNQHAWWPITFGTKGSN